MALPDDGPCTPWITWPDVVAVCGLTADDLAAIEALPADLKDLLLEEGSDLAYELTQRRYPGECTAVKTICAGCGCGATPCCCEPTDQIDLGRRFAVGEALEVVVAGVTLTDNVDYRIDRWRYLVRLGGLSWPRCVDVEDPSSFQVTWTYGRRPPAAGRRALARLVAEEAKSCAGLKCQLPQRTTEVRREGVSFTIIDSFKMLDDGKTGFYPFDRWLMAIKAGRRVAPGMYDPDACSDRRGVDTGQPDGS